MNRKADFYKNNRFESIRITNRIDSIRIANWNALLATALVRLRRALLLHIAELSGPCGGPPIRWEPYFEVLPESWEIFDRSQSDSATARYWNKAFVDSRHRPCSVLPVGVSVRVFATLLNPFCPCWVLELSQKWQRWRPYLLIDSRGGVEFCLIWRY